MLKLFRHLSRSIFGVAVSVCCLAIVTVLFSPDLFAQAKPQAAQAHTGPIIIPVKRADGHVLVPIYLLSFDGRALGMSLEVSLEEPETVVIHPTQMDLFLEWGSIRPKVEKGESIFINMIFKPDMEFSVPAQEVKYEYSFDRLMVQKDVTKYHSKQLDEHQIMGTLGRGFFNKYRTVFDLNAGTITLYPLSDDAVVAETVRPYQVKDKRIWIDVNYADNSAAPMMLGSENYDTYIDADLARALGKPAGDIAGVWLNDKADSAQIDLSRYMAFRPQSFKQQQNEAKRGAGFISGINLLEHFRVELDAAHSKVGFTRTKNPQYPQADLEFFKAELTGDPDQLRGYLERYPHSRLSSYAAARMMELRQAQPGVTDEQLLAALQWVIDTALPERRMEDCEPYIKKLRIIPGRTAFAIQASNLALKYSRASINIQAAYRLHNIVGEEYLKENRLEEAWTHFLSAAFMPLDPLQHRDNYKHNVMVQINLGLVYEKQERAARAYSRYRKASQMARGAIGQLMEMTDEQKASWSPDDKRWYGAIGHLIDALDRLGNKLSKEERELLDS